MDTATTTYSTIVAAGLATSGLVNFYLSIFVAAPRLLRALYATLSLTAIIFGLSMFDRATYTPYITIVVLVHLGIYATWLLHRRGVYERA